MSVQPAIPPGWPKFPVVSTDENNKKIASAPIRAPNSGRLRRVVIGEVF
ncbi:unannotated protein [freshwater metagenome]|uniref:Unannotated protein n=1 Tax=freshwater metagenome TaxID=449393 RepID=A0A6J7DHL8_9ZZZZ